MTRQETDSDPIDVVLTRTTAQTTPLTVSNAMPSAKAPAKVAHNWWVQVGEFRSRQAAHSQIDAVSRRFASVLDNARGSVDGQRRDYRARFSGMTEVAAKQTCSAVKNHGMPCLASYRA